MSHAPKSQGCAENRCGLALCMRCKHRPGIVADATLLRVLARLARWVWVVRMALTLQPWLRMPATALPPATVTGPGRAGRVAKVLRADPIGKATMPSVPSTTQAASLSAKTLSQVEGALAARAKIERRAKKRGRGGSKRETRKVCACRSCAKGDLRAGMAAIRQ